MMLIGIAIIGMTVSSVIADPASDTLSAQSTVDYKAYKVVKVETGYTTEQKSTGGITPLGGGSSSITQYVYGKNALGQRLWGYFQKIVWSYDGLKITSVTRTRWGEVYALFWSFDGHIGNSEQGGVGQWSYRAWTQGAFKLCLGGNIGCIQYKYPWIDQTVYGNGDKQSIGGGG